MMNGHVLKACCVVASMSASSLPATAQCDPLFDFGIDWYPGHEDMAPITSMAVFNPGDGPKLYAGREAGVPGWGLREYGDGRWNQRSGLSTSAVFVHDVGGGERLYYAVGSSIIEWDGATFVVIGQVEGETEDEPCDVGPCEINAIGALDTDFFDGIVDLVVAGGFSAINGVPADDAAYWNGSTWTAFAGPVDGVVYGIDPHPTQPVIYMTGSAGMQLYGQDTVRDVIVPITGTSYAVAVFNGPAYIGGTGGITVATHNVDGAVYDLLVWDDGAGERLYVAGDFDAVPGAGLTGLGGIAALDLAGNWSAVGGGVNATGGGDAVFALENFTETTAAGDSLYIGGGFTSGSGQDIARWGCEVLDPTLVSTKWDHRISVSNK